MAKQIWKAGSRVPFKNRSDVKSCSLHVRIKPSLYAFLKKEAENNEITISDLILNSIEHFFKKKF